MPKRLSPSEQLRRIIRGSGMSLLELHRETGLQPAAISRFLNGHSSMTMASVDRLAQVIDIHVKQGKK